MEQGDCKNNFPTSKDQWLQEVERQDIELIAWLDEFVASEEYAELLRARVHHASKQDDIKSRKLQKEHERRKVEYWSVSDQHNEISDSVHSSITMLEGKVEGSLTKLKIENTVANQRRGIEIIRDTILAAKQEHEAHALSMMEKSYDNRDKALSTLHREFRMSIPDNELTERVVDKLLKVRNARRNNAAKIQSNKIQVVSNILRDIKRDQMAKKMKTKTVPTIRKKKISSDYIEIFPEELATELDFLDSTKSDISEQIEMLIPQRKKNKKVKMDTKESSKTSAKATKSQKTKTITKKSDVTSKSKKSAKPGNAPIIENVIPPIIPNPNPRRKVLPEYVMMELLENITKLYNYLRDKESYEVEDGLAQDVFLPIDEGFFSRPNKIIFKDYQPGKRYKKEISLVNGNRIARKINLDRVIWNTDVEEDLLLEVESFGVRRVLPGMSFKVCLRFAPDVLNKTTDGKIIFLTSELRSERPQQFALNVVCVPLCAAVLISPTVVSFEEMPIWRARALAKQGRNYKTVTISNSGQKECKVVVSKIVNNQTMEQEWKKIISIIRIDDDVDEEKRILSLSNLEDPSMADPFPRNLVQQCVENVFNVFRFERNVFNIHPKSTVTLKCWLKDVSEAGYLVESYNFSIYERFLDGQLYCIGTQDVIVNSETTSHFLTSSMEILDFEVCVNGSAYQLDFDLTNPCKLAHHIRICFPSRMKHYLHASPGVTTILPNQTIKICIKFLPSDGIHDDNKFHDADVNLLEFPVYVTVQTKGYEDTPPLKIDVFAAVTEAAGVVLEPLIKLHPCYDDGLEFYDLGSCTTMETVYMDIQVNNKSLVPQQFGFLSLPNYITVAPNFGFGQLKPMQKATVRMTISPTKLDAVDNKGLLIFQLVLTTIKQCGALKKKSHNKEIVKRLKQMEDYVCKSRGSNSSKLKQDMQALKKAFKEKSLSSSILSSSSESVERFIQATEDDELLINVVKYDIEEEKELSSNMEAASTASRSIITCTNIINFQIQVIDVAVELSHQIIHLPDTPCGSYSMMSIDLMTHKIPGMKYQATFEIIGNHDEFEVQPSYGKLLCNKKNVIWIVVKPKVPQSVIEERAIILKRAEIDLQKAEEEAVDSPDVLAKNIGKKPKKAPKTTTDKKKSKEKKVGQNLGNQIAATVDDYYHAEMDVWRTTQPYLIEGLFTCRITYNSVTGITSCDRPPEEVYFKATCQVVAPNFIHDQKYQVIDFGTVVVGTHATRTIKFQNIQRKFINIDVSLTSPVGPYSSSAQSCSRIPPEYIYAYPVKFQPTEEQTEIEYFDVSSDNTSYFFILRGIGIQPNLVFNPNFTVCRISTTRGGFQDCSFDVKNESDMELTLHLQQVCELEGTMEQPVVTLDKKKMKINTKRPKFSTDLFDDEIHSLESSFEIRTESTLFHVLDNSNIDNTFRIAPHAKCNIKIRFGEVAKPAVKSTSTKGSVASSTGDTGKYFIAKYNIHVGLNYIKDIIIIGTIT